MKRRAKILGIVLGGVSFALVAAMLVAYAQSRAREGRRYRVPAAEVAVPEGEAALAEGERLYVSRGCADCHGARGEGRVVLDEAPARVVGTNLGRAARAFTPADMARAIRHGVAPDGRPLIFMPSHEYQQMRDDEVGHLIAYVRSLDPPAADLPPSEIRPLGRVLHVLDVMPLLPAERIDHDAPRAPAPAPAPTAEYGAYLAGMCTGCHGERLSGGPIPGAPVEQMGIPGNLTPHGTGLAAYTRERFFTVMREGRTPEGRVLDPAQMPWRNYARLTDTELEALWLHLARLEPRPFGGR